jgi:hypothetical protein
MICSFECTAVNKQHRFSARIFLGAGIIDLMLAVFFVLAFRASRRAGEIRPLSWSQAGTKVPLPFGDAPCEADNLKKSSP